MFSNAGRVRNKTAAKTFGCTPKSALMVAAECRLRQLIFHTLTLAEMLCLFLPNFVGTSSVFIMPYVTNQAWTHEVPRARKRSGKRISVTLRGFLAD